MIRTYENPDRAIWPNLIQRPKPAVENLQTLVGSIIDSVRQEGDRALFRFSREFDHVDLVDLKVTEEEWIQAEKCIATELKTAIQTAKHNIETFHKYQRVSEETIDTMKGVKCWRVARPIEKVGLYIPGGSAPLFSTVLMLAVPARIAGCGEIVLCSPPRKDGTIHPAIIYTAKVTGVTTILKVGGAQAIAALALGTESIPRVDKIFGPGNHFVTEAKVMAQQLGVAIDIPAGPSEVLIVADESANPEFVAADMLAQAEHGSDSQVVLATNHHPLLQATREAISRQLRQLPRREIAGESIEKSMIVYFDDLNRCIEFSNEYAPEHLILSLEQPDQWVSSIINAGSVFMGHYSPESVGDYASGTNHTLPTAGWARSYSGVSLDSFVKKITFQQLTREGLQTLGPLVEVMAEAESLIGHKRAVSYRLKSFE